MRGLAPGLLIAALALGAPAGAKTVYPYDRKACFPNGFEKEFRKQGLANLVRDKQASHSNNGATSETFAFLGRWRTLLVFEHSADQCRLRRQRKPYDTSCPHVNFPASWIVANAPGDVWGKSRRQINAQKDGLREKLDAAKADFRKACKQ